VEGAQLPNRKGDTPPHTPRLRHLRRSNSLVPHILIMEPPQFGSHTSFFRKRSLVFCVSYTFKCVIFNLKMHQDVFGGRVPPGPADGTYRSPRPSIWIE